MAAGLTNVVASLQNGVQAINNLRVQLTAFFPRITGTSSAPPSTVGAITFDSSLAVGFLQVTTSSGFSGWVPIYTSS
jgi:hypothetical protein